MNLCENVVCDWCDSTSMYQLQHTGICFGLRYKNVIENSNAVFHWQIFVQFFVYISKNPEKSFHWANIPVGVKSERNFWGQISINLNPSLRLDWDLWFIIFVFTCKQSLKMAAWDENFHFGPKSTQSHFFGQSIYSKIRRFLIKLGYFFLYMWINNLPMENGISSVGVI